MANHMQHLFRFVLLCLCKSRKKAWLHPHKGLSLFYCNMFQLSAVIIYDLDVLPQFCCHLHEPINLLVHIIDNNYTMVAKERTLATYISAARYGYKSSLV